MTKGWYSIYDLTYDADSPMEHGEEVLVDLDAVKKTVAAKINWDGKRYWRQILDFTIGMDPDIEKWEMKDKKHRIYLETKGLF